MMKRICKVCHKETPDLSGVCNVCRATMRHHHKKEEAKFDKRPAWLKPMAKVLMR
jgi:predicted amidophosphoribosyltransferase